MAQSLDLPAAGLPVAGLGASAGSAGALQALLGARAPGSGLAYGVIRDAVAAEPRPIRRRVGRRDMPWTLSPDRRNGAPHIPGWRP